MRPDIRSHTGQHYAWMLGGAIGQLKAKNDWEIRAWYQYAEQFALDPNLVDSDIFDSRVNEKGVAVKAGYMLADAISFNLTWAYSWRINGALGTGGIGDIAVNPLDQYQTLSSGYEREVLNLKTKSKPSTYENQTPRSLLWRWWLQASPRHADRLVIKGSDTLGAKLVPQLAEQFKAQHPGTTFDIAAEGSTTGIAAIIDGTAQIGMSSRRAKTSEVGAAREGKDMKPTIVAFDGIAVIVNSANPIKGLTKKQVEQIFTGDVTDWSAVGGSGGKISVYTRNTSSGTYSDFKELAMKKRDYAAARKRWPATNRSRPKSAKIRTASVMSAWRTSRLAE